MTHLVHHTADGGGIAAAVQSWALRSGFTLKDAENVSAYRLPNTFRSLETAVENAIEKDEQESWNLMSELEALWKDGPFGYWPGRQDFKAAGNQRIEWCRHFLGAIDSSVSSVKENVGPVPGDLEADARAWQESSTRISDIQARIAHVEQIPGWQGEASVGYGQRSTVQRDATQELQGMAVSMANAINQIALFNRALFLFMDREMIRVTAEINTLPGSQGDAYYRRVSAAAPLLKELSSSIQKARQGEPVKEVAQNLQAQVHNVLSAPALLTPGSWPTGGGQAGTPPEQTDGVPDTDAADDTRVDGPGSHSAGNPGNDGVYRNED